MITVNLSGGLAKSTNKDWGGGRDQEEAKIAARGVDLGQRVRSPSWEERMGQGGVGRAWSQRAWSLSRAEIKAPEGRIRGWSSKTRSRTVSLG